MATLTTTSEFMSKSKKANVVSRDEWGARPRQLEGGRYKEALPLLRFVYFAFKTGPPCTTTEECCAAVRRIQDDHMDKRGLLDIAYNFLIGGDGRVYEGRGWRYRPDRSLSRPYSETHKKRYDFAYIGDYTDPNTNVPPLMYQKSMDHILLGVKYEYISEKFEIFGEDPFSHLNFTKEFLEEQLVVQSKLKKTDEIN